MGLSYRPRSSFTEQTHELLGGNRTLAQVELDVPLVFAPAPNFYCGVGPILGWTYALSGDLLPRAHDWLLTFGVSTVIGAWF